MAALPCFDDTDCITVTVDPDTGLITVDPIIDPDSNLLACGPTGLNSRIEAGCGISLAPGADLGTMIASALLDSVILENAMTCDPVNGLYVPLSKAQVFFNSVEGSLNTPITGTPSGPLGPQPGLVINNPSTLRSAQVFGMFNTSTEAIELDDGEVWYFKTQAALDGVTFLDFDQNIYDTAALTLASTPWNVGYGGHSVPFVGTLAAGASQTLAIRRYLTVASTTGGTSNVAYTGTVSMWAIVVAP